MGINLWIKWWEMIQKCIFNEWQPATPVGTNLVSCPDPLHMQSVSGVLSTVLVAWGRADLGFEITNQIAEDLIIFA